MDKKTASAFLISPETRVVRVTSAEWEALDEMIPNVARRREFASRCLSDGIAELERAREEIAAELRRGRNGEGWTADASGAVSREDDTQ